MQLLHIENVSKSYRDHLALSKITLSVPKGSIFGLLGPNGAGKTTLIRIITRIIYQDEGEVFLNGEKVTPAIVRKIGYLPEERGLYKKMKVGEQLLYLAQLKGLERAEAVRRIKSWLTKLNLIDWHNKPVEDLSKGMAQKVQFIATVVHQPDLIILDEPFSGFDPINANLIKDEILELRDQGTTIIFSTHRMESVEELCDHIALISRSRKILEGPKTKVKEENRDGTYVVTHSDGKLNGASFTLLNSSVNEFGDVVSVIRDDQKIGSNGILKNLISQVEVRSFMERIPSINDIFISKVESQA